MLRSTSEEESHLARQILYHRRKFGRAVIIATEEEEEDFLKGEACDLENKEDCEACQ